MDGVVHHPKGALSDADSSFFADVGVTVDTAGYAELFFFAVPVSVQVVVVCFPAGADMFVCDSHRFVPGFVEGQKKIERRMKAANMTDSLRPSRCGSLVFADLMR